MVFESNNDEFATAADPPTPDPPPVTVRTFAPGFSRFNGAVTGFVWSSSTAVFKLEKFAFTSAALIGVLAENVFGMLTVAMTDKPAVTVIAPTKNHFMLFVFMMFSFYCQFASFQLLESHTPGCKVAVPTVTSTVAVLEPLLFVAVSVKVLVAFTATLFEVEPVTSPTPTSIERLVAPVTVQASVVLPPPAGRLAGVAVKLEITGLRPPPLGVTVMVSVCVAFGSPAATALI